MPRHPTLHAMPTMPGALTDAGRPAHRADPPNGAWNASTQTPVQRRRPHASRPTHATPWLAMLCLCAAAWLLPADAAPREGHKRKATARTTVTQADKTPANTYAHNPQAQALADDIASRFGIDAAWTRQAVSQARQLPLVQRLVLPPPAGVPKNWAAYRSRFIEERRIAAGVRFWRQHASWLERAQQRFGVPAEMIVAIIGVETLYGQHMGSFRVLDALATLALDFPAAHPRAAERGAFFREELGHFLQQQHEARSDPARVRGSYAGAIGLPQFMPSSRAKFAVDFDGDGRINLLSAADAIGSVAHYFKMHGWQSGMPTHYALRFDETRVDKEALLLPDILPTFSAAQMEQRGVVLDEPGRQHTGPLALVELQNGAEPPSYVAGTENFYVVTRYNWSSYYAMAVIELAREVRTALDSEVIEPEPKTGHKPPAQAVQRKTAAVKR